MIWRDAVFHIATNLSANPRLTEEVPNQDTADLSFRFNLPGKSATSLNVNR